MEKRLAVALGIGVLFAVACMISFAAIIGIAGDPVMVKQFMSDSLAYALVCLVVGTGIAFPLTFLIWKDKK